uniref:Uncharacterized protein n=1 Tax=Meloidogyne incognita TaxID=6306 RepID=A0A914LNQ0_MELIC
MKFLENVDKEKEILPDECLRHCWLLKNRERAALAGAASRAISPALLPCEQQKPLAVEKLRSYEFSLIARSMTLCTFICPISSTSFHSF